MESRSVRFTGDETEAIEEVAARTEHNFSGAVRYLVNLGIEVDQRRQSRQTPAGRAMVRLPEDFTVTDAMAKWAAEYVPGVDIASETGSFRDYWANITGARAKKHDWPAAWRNWMRKADAAGRPPRRASAAEQARRLAEKYRKEGERGQGGDRGAAGEGSLF